MSDVCPHGSSDREYCPGCLRACVDVARDTFTTVEEWLGHASTREAATDSLWRLRRALEAVFGKFKAESKDPLAWRGSLVHAHDVAGVGVGEDDVLRLRKPTDRNWQLASGEPVADVIAHRDGLAEALREAIAALRNDRDAFRSHGLDAAADQSHADASCAYAALAGAPEVSNG